MSTPAESEKAFSEGYNEGFFFANIFEIEQPKFRPQPLRVPLLNLSRFSEGFLAGLKAANAKLSNRGEDLLEGYFE